MSQYSLGVALFDFVPVVLSGLAMAFLAGAIRRCNPPLGPWAVAAAVLIPFGGACKASWKLIIALGGEPIPALENLLFISLAPGFVVMAYALAHAQAPVRTVTPHPRLALQAAAPLAGALALALLLPGSRAWFFLLLLVTTVATITLLAHAIIAARAAGLRGPLAAFAYALVATLAMGGLSRLAAGESSAWLQESLNVSIQAALALGFRRLSRHMQEELA